MTASEKYAAIVALLKDEHGKWKEDVNGGDLVQDVSLIIDAPETAATLPRSSALEAEHPWCAWITAFAHESDWDTTGFGLERLVGLSILLTTADGRSRPASITEWQHIPDPEHASNDPARTAGILVTELDTENYEPKDPNVREFVPYEDIREICVY
jgi:hypothetical protein